MTVVRKPAPSLGRLSSFFKIPSGVGFSFRFSNRRLPAGPRGCDAEGSTVGGRDTGCVHRGRDTACRWIRGAAQEVPPGSPYGVREVPPMRAAIRGTAREVPPVGVAIRGAAREGCTV